MNDIVENKKGHNIVNHSFAHKPDGLLVVVVAVVVSGVDSVFSCVLDHRRRAVRPRSAPRSHG